METHDLLTDDLMEEILLRLPVRHLLRFRCVSKSWCALIDSTKFIQKHHDIQYAISLEERDVPLFLISRTSYYDRDPSQLYLLSKKQGDAILCLTPDLDRYRVPNGDQNLFRGLCCMGVVNGIVGLCWGEVKECLGLWNPATREFKTVPSPQRSGGGLNTRAVSILDILALGFDPKSRDFKIVRTRFRSFAEIYSLSANSWTSLKPPDPLPLLIYPSLDGYCNGVYYWTAAVNSPRRLVILSFDFSSETFKFFDPPPAIVKDANSVGCFHWTIGQYMELLALICSRQNSFGSLYSFDIWVVSEFDVGDDSEISLSWQHVFTIEPLSGLYAERFVASRMDGDILLHIYVGQGKRECTLYNPNTRTFKNLGFIFDGGYKYVESLFPLSRMQIQSYQELNNVKKRKSTHLEKEGTFADERSTKVSVTVTSTNISF